MNPKFKSIAKLFQKLPGVGPRQAARFVIALIDKPETELQEFGQAITNLKKEICFCQNCFNISDNSQKDHQSGDRGVCFICHNQRRDLSKILVVEKVTDLDAIEKTGLYKGLYHVLGGAINPIDGINPETLKIRELEQRVSKLPQVELIIATNLNTAGETTSLYIRKLFQNKKGLTITRLGRGLASGSHLEYADEITLKHALEYRK